MENRTILRITEKEVFSYFVFAWMAFGFIAMSYVLYQIIASDEVVNSWNLFKNGFWHLVFAAYIFAFLKYHLVIKKKR